MTQGYASNGRTFGSTTNSSGAWVRNPEWLPLSVTAPEQKVQILCAVWNNGSNHIAFTFTGAITVDWGDGSAPENVSSGVKAQHNLSYAGCDAGSLTSLGYRQAVVTITPQSGHNLVSADFSVRTSLIGQRYCDGFLDVTMSAPNMTSLSFSSYSTISHGMMEQVTILGTTGLASGVSIFWSCNGLRAIAGTAWCSSISDFTTMFYGCSSLQSVPAFDTSAGTNFTGMFQNCSSLQSVPALDTSAGTNFASMFNACPSLQSAPLSGTRYSISYASCLLQAAALDAIYTGLGTAAGAQTITVSGNPGTGGDTPSIATGKGWTVSGS